ncbi:hypothetical protein B0H11DRAFT_1979553 [Mycena galericulata]|nr:hypothetical protein B0H11DRAFT_1979553 [Mycena galericulata]
MPRSPLSVHLARRGGVDPPTLLVRSGRRSMLRRRKITSLRLVCPFIFEGHILEVDSQFQAATRGREGVKMTWSRTNMIQNIMKSILTTVVSSTLLSTRQQRRFQSNKRSSFAMPAILVLVLRTLLSVLALLQRPVQPDYDWFCVFEKGFLAGAFCTTINMLNRGNLLVCRSATVIETECPGLQEWINKLYDSLVGLAEAYASDEDFAAGDEEEYDVAAEILQESARAGLLSSLQLQRPSSSPIAGPSTSQSSSSASATGPPSSLPVAGPSGSSQSLSAARPSRLRSVVASDTGGGRTVKNEPRQQILKLDPIVIELSD